MSLSIGAGWTIVPPITCKLLQANQATGGKAKDHLQWRAESKTDCEQR